LIWLFGEIDNIQFEDDALGGVESSALLRGTTNIGSKAVSCRMAFSWTHSLKNRIQIRGSSASAEMRLSEPDVVVIKRRIAGEPAEMRISQPAQQSRPAGFHSFRLQWEDFVAAVQRHREPFVPAASTVECLRVIEKAYSVRKIMQQPWVDQ